MTAALVATDTHVELEYTLFDHVSGEQLTDEPIRADYIQGYGQVLPVLETGLKGMAAGQKRSLVAQPDEAFGSHDAEGIFELEKDGLEGSDDLTVGEEFVASGPDGDVVMRVLEVRPETLVVDTNHPLAGKVVRLEVAVLAVRDATDEEIAEARAELEADACGCGQAHNHGENAEQDAEHAAAAAADSQLVELKARRS
jgi:FKBP-type peptidyl-prolyl cis-trans isomerase SlyD